jgi:hypothetical protein
MSNKFKIIIAGWDTEGSTTDITFNQDFKLELEKKGLWTHEVVKAINKSRGDVDQIPKISNDIKEKFRNKIFDTQQRDIKSEESVYLVYEKILTDNHKLIENEDYLQWLMNFERNVQYEDEGNFGRRWTQKANTYAEVLDETDIEQYGLKTIWEQGFHEQRFGCFECCKDFCKNKVIDLRSRNNDFFISIY